jgi:hypothetical protein
MITLYLTARLLPTTNAILFSKDLDKNLKEVDLINQSFSKFCSVCRIFMLVFDTSVIDEYLVSKIRFEVHSGSMFETEDQLYRELDIVIYDLQLSSSIKFSLTKHT